MMWGVGSRLAAAGWLVNRGGSTSTGTSQGGFPAFVPVPCCRRSKCHPPFYDLSVCLKTLFLAAGTKLVQPL